MDKRNAKGIEIKTEAVAKRVVRACDAQFKLLNKLLVDIEPVATPKEFKAVRSAVGEVLGRTSLDVLFPVFERFPHLDKHGVMKGAASQ